MSDALDQLERTLDRQMTALDSGRAPVPSADCLERVKQAVVQESERLRRVRAHYAVARRWGAVAAAILLVFVLTWRADSPDGTSEAGGAAALLDEWDTWYDAYAESSDRVTMLVTEEWAVFDAEAGADEETEIDALFESLEQSLMIGT